MTGVSGIGGSVIVMPFLLIAMNLNMRRAAATNIFIGATFTSFAALSHIVINNNINWNTAILFATGGILGVIIGFTLSLKTDETKLKKKFALIFGTIGIAMLVNNLIG